MCPSMIKDSLKTLKKGISTKNTTASANKTCIKMSIKFIFLTFFIICIYKINQG